MRSSESMEENFVSSNIDDYSDDGFEALKPMGDIAVYENEDFSSNPVAASEVEAKSSAMSKPSIYAMPSIICRICLNNDDLGRLLTPCRCKGTHAFVHQGCLEYWLSRSGLSHCELCLFPFPMSYELRYGLFESIRIWFSHPAHRALLQSDILLCMLLTVITFGLVAISMFGMFYLTTSQSIIPHSYIARYWTETAIGVFLGIVLFAFILNTIVVVKANIIPWFRWWRRSREIQLIVRDNNANQNV